MNLSEPKKVTDSAEGVVLSRKAYNMKHDIGAVCEVMDVLYMYTADSSPLLAFKVA